VYNHVIKKCDWLCHRGNGSFGERLDIYRTVARIVTRDRTLIGLIFIVLP
jgi:hypothetical protein